MSTEAIEEWAARTAHRLDAEGWCWTNSDKYCHEWLEAIGPYPRGATVVELKAALRAYRDRVAAGLSDAAYPDVRAAALRSLCLKGEHMGVGPHHRELARDGLARIGDEHPHLSAYWVHATPFGREIARVMDGTLTDDDKQAQVSQLRAQARRCHELADREDDAAQRHIQARDAMRAEAKKLERWAESIDPIAHGGRHD